MTSVENLKDSALKKYREAGEITAKIRKEILQKIHPGMKLLNLTRLIEDRTRKLGAKSAFPPNISVNDITAHYTPSFNDEKTIKKGDLVKIDIGVHIDGYIGDMAFTYCSRENDLVQTANKALENTIEKIRPGVTVSELSSAIQETAEEADLGVIVNLTGHTLERNIFHGEPSIPNIKNNNSHRFEEGDVIALEPFITQSNGRVKKSSTVEIYRYLQDRPVRNREARKILKLIKKEYRSFPFAKRWLAERFSPFRASRALRQLESAGVLESYPILREQTGKKVAQAEHTIIVAEEPIVTTR